MTIMREVSKAKLKVLAPLTHGPGMEASYIV